MNITKDLPNTHRRSTAETAMSPIGQTSPVIHIHLGGNSEQNTNPTLVRIELTTSVLADVQLTY